MNQPSQPQTTRIKPPRSVHDVHVQELTPLISPRQLKQELPTSNVAHETVLEARNAIKHILLGQDQRVLVIVGPCSIHDEKAALEYAERLNNFRLACQDTLLVVMRVYFEKPRTTTGWKGLIYDPHLNDTFDIGTGLRIARRLLLQIAEMGLPTATELLDPIVPQYIADLIAWSAIGARTTESQTHRQMASGLSMPVGYKNNTDGNLQVAINAMLSARAPHSFLGIDQEGRICVVHTMGNTWGHMILRGGSDQPNYDPETVREAMARLSEARLPAKVMVDCSHANSGKDFSQQEAVWRSVLEQRAQGNDGIIGLMLESNLFEGQQPMTDVKNLKYGVSITDECVSWSKTEQLLTEAHKILSSR